MLRASEPVRVTAGTSIGRRERKPPRSVSPHGRTVRSQCSGTHTESGCQGWWDISQRISTTRAAPRMRGSRRGIRAQPMTSRFAQLIDALNRESRQILHRFLRNCVAPASRFDYEQLSDGIKLQNIFECRDCALETIRCQQKSTTRYGSSLPVVENLFRIARCFGVSARRVQPRLDSRFDPPVPERSPAWQEPAFSFATLPSPPGASSSGLSAAASR